MPLTPFQQQLRVDLTAGSANDLGYLAGGAALHFESSSARFSRDEPRDFVDALYVHEHVSPTRRPVLGRGWEGSRLYAALVARIAQRSGQIPARRFSRLDLVEPFDLVAAKNSRREALEEADAFCRSRPPGEIGCLYWARSTGRFVMPPLDGPASDDIVPDYGSPGGVLPDVSDGSIRGRRGDGLRTGTSS